MNVTTTAPPRATRAQKATPATVTDFSDLTDEQSDCRMYASEALELLALLASTTESGSWKDQQAQERNSVLLKTVQGELRTCTCNPKTSLAHYVAAARNSIATMDTASDEWEYAPHQSDEHDLIFGLYRGICAILELLMVAAKAKPTADSAAERAPADCNRKAGWAFSSIGGLADAVRTLCADIVEDGADNWENYTVNKVVAARELCSQIGVLSDIGLNDTGNHSMRMHNDAAGWVCPLAYHAESQGGAA